MIQVTYTKRNRVALLEPITIAIDPEKIVSSKDVGGVAEIEYAETYDRQRQPIIYTLTTTTALVLAQIAGNYNTNITTPYITVTVYDLANVTSELIYLQEKYIVDIRAVTVKLGDLGLFPFLRIEYVPGAFVPVVVYAANIMDEVIVTSLPTTTAEATTTEEATTTVGN